MSNAGPLPLPPDFVEMAQHINALGRLYPECTPRARRELGRTIWILEKSGATHFGGPHVLAWYLVSRALSRRPTWLQLCSYTEQLKAERLIVTRTVPPWQRKEAT